MAALVAVLLAWGQVTALVWGVSECGNSCVRCIHNQQTECKMSLAGAAALSGLRLIGHNHDGPLPTALCIATQTDRNVILVVYCLCQLVDHTNALAT